MRRLILAAGLLATMALLDVNGLAQAQTNPRFGRWRIKSDAPPPTSNIMTYEPLAGGKGMKITIDAVNKDGVATKWGYNTNFDGKDEPLYGNPGTDTGSVRIINDRINEIIYKKAGKVTQVLTNILSPDGDTIGVVYMRMDPEGKVTKNVTFATYEKIK
ncbi:MAG: hypothetical protein JWL71_2447 [Acidobacteria bacterium]|jgi:hypothetical protein|nr:hypothetical protein [Acidobacteriota bacterium]